MHTRGCCVCVGLRARIETGSDPHVNSGQGEPGVSRAAIRESQAAKPVRRSRLACTPRQPRLVRIVGEHRVVCHRCLRISCGARRSVQPRVGLRGNRVEEEEALRTCEELLAAGPEVSTSTFFFHFSPRPIVRSFICVDDDSQAQRDIPVPVRVVLLEHIRHPLQADACLHEQIEAQHPLPDALVAPSS